MPYYRFDEMIQPDYQKYNSIYKVAHFIKTFNKKNKEPLLQTVCLLSKYPH